MRAQTSTLTQVWVLMRPRSSWSWWREIQTITQRSGNIEPPFGRRAYLVKLAAFEPRMDVSCHLKFELSVLAPDMEYDRSSKKKRAQDCVFTSYAFVHPETLLLGLLVCLSGLLLGWGMGRYVRNTTHDQTTF